MDAVIAAGPVTIELVAVAATANTAIVVDDLAIELVSLLDAALIITTLRNTGNSLTAVAPDFNSIGGERALAFA